MKLTVIGKYGPYAIKQGSATSCYLVEENNNKIVLDFGSGALANLSSVVDIKDVDAMFISHLHYDHTSDLLTLQYKLQDAGKTIKIYTAYSQSEYYKELFNSKFFEVINVDENSEIKLNTLTLKFFKTVHPMVNLGIRIIGNKTMCYTGDTVYYDNLAKDLEGSDLVLIDAVKPSTFNGPHLKTIEAVNLQQQLGCEFILTHFSNYIPTKEIELNDKVQLAEELAEYEF